ncbi:DUF4198 domain-containing protein [Ramlibacter sp.]|uniref:DUF4198 domain-containing protein n=1 Tax=Ramlibacter sp. TaxID=1917967 RepID=UPI00184F72E2|nr:DUF4198 domain-containing protein [Ramlibacter sp.]MBA2672054.1 DUF4198 domain-containing protein [Ramlibacter sp.]
MLGTGTQYPIADSFSPPSSVSSSGCLDGAGRTTRLLARWAALREQGLPWQERYRKFARIETSDRFTLAPALRAIRKPAGQPLEIVVSGDAPLLAGNATEFQVLANGVPVPMLAVELHSERSPLGIWSQSDAEGRLRFMPPFGVAWLLHATLLEPDGPAGWQSRFVTLAFDAS